MFQQGKRHSFISFPTQIPYLLSHQLSGFFGIGQCEYLVSQLIVSKIFDGNGYIIESIIFSRFRKMFKFSAILKQLQAFEASMQYPESIL